MQHNRLYYFEKLSNYSGAKIVHLSHLCAGFRMFAKTTPHRKEAALFLLANRYIDYFLYENQLTISRKRPVGKKKSRGYSTYRHSLLSITLTSLRFHLLSSRTMIIIFRQFRNTENIDNARRIQAHYCVTPDRTVIFSQLKP